jgi:hypothetical protein
MHHTSSAHPHGNATIDGHFARHVVRHVPITFPQSLEQLARTIPEKLSTTTEKSPSKNRPKKVCFFGVAGIASVATDSPAPLRGACRSGDPSPIASQP